MRGHEVCPSGRNERSDVSVARANAMIGTLRQNSALSRRSAFPFLRHRSTVGKSQSEQISGMVSLGREPCPGLASYVNRPSFSGKSGSAESAHNRSFIVRCPFLNFCHLFMSNILAARDQVQRSERLKMADPRRPRRHRMFRSLALGDVRSTDPSPRADRQCAGTNVERPQQVDTGCSAIDR